MLPPRKSYASSKKKALQFFEQFKDRWEKDVPSAVATLERSLESCLSFMHFPNDEWISLRTSNIVERLNKEFKRRTKQMEILAGEASCYRLLAFISLRMELHWRANPVGRVRKNPGEYARTSPSSINSHKRVDTTHQKSSILPFIEIESFALSSSYTTHSPPKRQLLDAPAPICLLF
jgi:hypothetical protein